MMKKLEEVTKSIQKNISCDCGCAEDAARDAIKVLMEPNDRMMDNFDGGEDTLRSEKTTAVEMVEQCKIIKSENLVDDTMRRIRNEALEEAAQVTEELEGYLGHSDNIIAAAIRELKE